MAARCAFTLALPTAPASRTERVKPVLVAAEAADVHPVTGHQGFAPAVLKIKSDLVEFLLTAAREGRSVPATALRARATHSLTTAASARIFSHIPWTGPR